MLFIDVNLGKEKGVQRIILYEDDDPKVIAERFCLNHTLSENKKRKLAEMIRIKMKEHLEKLQRSNAKK